MSRTIVFALIVVALTCTFAHAQLEVGGGYSQLRLNGADQNFHNADGFGFNGRFSITPVPIIIDPLRIGVDLGWRQYAQNGAGNSTANPSSSDLNIINADLRIAWRQPFGVFFIEPSLAGGVLVGVYSTQNQFDASSFDQTATGWSIRPGLAAGVHLAIFTAGIEGNYRWGRLTYNNGAGGDLREWYAGVFAGLSF